MFDIPREMLPAIRAVLRSGSVRRRPGGTARCGGEVPVCGALGDQQAATLGQVCTNPGEAKNTYGTGNFMLLNTGTQVVPSKAGLLTTVCYKLGAARRSTRSKDRWRSPGRRCSGCAISSASSSSASEIEALALTVEDTGGAYFVPAFSGLFAPYWRSDARGAIVGLSRFHTRAHLARATLEAICFQTRAVLDAMVADSGVQLELLKVDGGATVNDTLMQLQADILGVPVVRPVVAGDHRARRRLRRRPRDRILEGPRPSCARTGKRIASGSRARPPTSASRAIAAGRRRSSGRSTGWTWGSDLKRVRFRVH